MQILRGLLTTDGFTFEGEHFQVRDATLRPRPVQQPHPPIWIGASARYADVWHSWGTPESMTGKSQRLSAMAEAAGRDPGAITRASSLSLEDDVDTIAANVEAWEKAGFEYLVCGWPAEGRAAVERFAGRFL